VLLKEGLSLHQCGQLGEASARYILVLESFPNHPDTLDLYGVLLHQLGQNETAISFLDQAVASCPNDAGFHNHRGVCLQALHRLIEAREAFETARSLRPEMPEAALNLATVLTQLALYGDAERAARDAARLAPKNVDAQLALSMVLKRRECHLEAAEILEETRRICAPNIRVLESLTQNYAILGETEAAGKAARRALVFLPQTSSAYVFLNEQQNNTEWAKRGTRVSPDDTRLWLHLSNQHIRSTDNASSENSAKRAMLLSPKASTSYLNMATCAMRVFNLGRARKIAYRGLVVNPNEHGLAICASECERSRGNIAKGWELYERRGKLSNALPRLGLPPEWDRATPPTGPLLVCAEQGVGDEFIFLNCLPDLLEMVANVIVECDERCLPLFRRTFPSARWIPRTVREIMPGEHAWDYRSEMDALMPSAHIMVASLPALAQVALGRPAIKNGYLRVDTNEAKDWRSWLASLPALPKIGISWRSGVVDALHAEYYFTPEQLLEAMGPNSATFVSLLYADATQEIESVQKTHSMTIHEPPSLYQRDELDRLAALISQLDMVVTADTSVCAMAAACGVPTIRLEASYMLLSNSHDALFENLYPCRDTEAPFKRDLILRRASLKYMEWLSILKAGAGVSFNQLYSS
jgi:Tfp pilus assembly protein PilF